MKKLITLIAVLVGLQSVAQNIPPQAINFQGVAIDKNGIPVPGMDELGNPIQNSAIRVRFSILTGSATGTISYQEEHLTTTDEFGRFNLEIGRGTATNGVFSAINWGGDKQFLQVEVDLSALGTNFSLASVQEFLSVPYALYAKTAGSTGDGDTDSTNEIQTLSLTGNLLEISSGNTVTLPSQTLSIIGSTLTISDGNSVVIPDAQTLSLAGSTLSISNGNSVSIPANTDNQTLSVSGNTLSILNGNSVTLPISIDNDTTNELQTLSLSNGILSISKGNSIVLPSPGNALANNSQGCLSSPKFFQLPLIASQGLNTVIAYHDSIALIQSEIYFPSDTVFYLHNFSNNTTTTIPIIGRILHVATSDSLIFLSSLKNIFTLNLENGTLLTKQLLSIPYISMVDVDHKTKNFYFSHTIQNQSVIKISRYNPLNNTVVSITLPTFSGYIFKVMNSDTLIAVLNSGPAYLKFSTNTTISNLVAGPLQPVGVYVDYCKCYILDSLYEIRRYGLNYQVTSSLLLGFRSSSFSRMLKSTNSKSYVASINYYQDLNYSPMTYINNISGLKDHYVIEFDVNTGLVSLLYKDLTLRDRVMVTDRNLLTTINRPSCINGAYNSSFVLLVD